MSSLHLILLALFLLATREGIAAPTKVSAGLMHANWGMPTARINLAHVDSRGQRAHAMILDELSAAFRSRDFEIASNHRDTRHDGRDDTMACLNTFAEFAR